MSRRKIVVVTPVKNEEWILERFLAVTSRFADVIVVADQRSTDRSREICARFPKVHLIDNDSPGYDEAYRQRLLLAAARRLVPGERIILALDADELLAADALDSASWDPVRDAAPGTGLYFEKPDMLADLRRARRGTGFFPLGFVDDDAEQGGVLIHSTRVPLRPGHARFEVPGIRFIHLALVRPAEYRARQRHYSVIENINGTKSLWWRLAYYSPALYNPVLEAGATPAPAEWLGGWRRHGIDLEAFASSELNHFNRQVLALLRQHGARRFFFDDIWDADWPALEAEFARADNRALTGAALPRPGAVHAVLRQVLIAGLRARAAWRRPLL
jgi:hypothetical protein